MNSNLGLIVGIVLGVLVVTLLVILVVILVVVIVFKKDNFGKKGIAVAMKLS